MDWVTSDTGGGGECQEGCVRLVGEEAAGPGARETVPSEITALSIPQGGWWDSGVIHLSYAASQSPHGMRDAKQSLSGSAAWHRAARCRGRGGHCARGAQQMFAVSSARLCFLLGHRAPGLVLSSLETGDPATALLLPWPTQYVKLKFCLGPHAGCWLQAPRELWAQWCVRGNSPRPAPLCHMFPKRRPVLTAPLQLSLP